MNNIVLKSLSVKNFASFNNTAFFTTQADGAKKEYLTENTFRARDNYFNKISYIFGANGSGKSNLCKALLQIQKIISMAPIFAANNPKLMEIPLFKNENFDNHFKFDIAAMAAPAEYSIEIIFDNILYGYSFQVLNGDIIFECLTKKNKRTETILSRNSSDFKSIQLKSELSSFTPNLYVVKPQALCLSMAAFLNNPFAEKLVSAIIAIVVLNMSGMRHLNDVNDVNSDHFSENRIKNYLNFLQSTDPTLADLHVSFTKNKMDSKKIPLSTDFEERELVVMNVNVDVRSEHYVYKQGNVTEKISLPFLEFESNGTIKYFGILPSLLDSLESGSPLILDEIENGLHPNIVRDIIGLYNSEHTNPLHAQLICTTHCVNLIENKVRRDQVWVIDKDKYGQSKITRVSDSLGIRTSDNIAHKYLQGAFGGIPKFSSLA